MPSYEYREITFLPTATHDLVIEETAPSYGEWYLSSSEILPATV